MRCALASRILLPTADNILMLHSAPRGSLCAEAFRAIEADLEASVLAGWRLSTCVAGLRKASELFKH